MSNVKLLPLPAPPCRGTGWEPQYREADMQDYARANREPLLAEIEALRAEVERLNAELSRLMVIAGYGGVSRDAPDRLILASEVYDGIQSCDKWCDVRRVVYDGQPMPESATAYVRADRAERLAEALDTIARVGKASRNQTTRTRWIVARAISALNGDDDWQALSKPKGFHDALLHTTAAQENDHA